VAGIPEVFEIFEKGFVTEQNFRDFTFTCFALLYTRNNSSFFKGTVVEQAVADALRRKEHRGPRARRRLTSRVMGREHAGRQLPPDDR